MDYLAQLKKSAPLIHCITNTVTVNDCANAVLAVGARPVMAEHPLEAAEITSRSDALLINIGSITDSKIEAMKNAALSAKEKKIPFVLDCVGVSSSKLRYELVMDLIRINTPHIIKGNASEIAALCTGELSGGGVDAEVDISAAAAADFSKKTGSVIAVTGKTDTVTDGQRISRIHNGCDILSKITGTGCMLGCITAAVLTESEPYSAAEFSAALMGICGEAAAANCVGTGTFRMRLLDELSGINDADVAEKIKLG